ncbi:hypothetical protein ABR737_35585 [Streptomyces sp. Edi2]|uniref:hypothetical protein n=1 Tax=Streptomyces sp. Edi2 TaxID=3162528 RepID=UPI003305BB0F
MELKGPNDTWTHASTMNAGRFGGGNTRSDDLMVTWTDGEVTLYTNVDAKGLHAEKQLVKPPDTTWPHARDIAAGDFRTGTGDQDLFVRWRKPLPRPSHSEHEDAQGARKAPWRRTAFPPEGN